MAGAGIAGPRHRARYGSTWLQGGPQPGPRSTSPVAPFGRHPGQNSPCTHARLPEPGQNSPGTHAGMLKPVQNSPGTHAGMLKPVQNSPGTHAGPPQPVQNSPSTHAGPPQPVQNSPYTAKIAHFAPFSACRAKIVTLSAQALAAGRLFSRCGFEQSKLGDLCRATSGSFAHGALHLHRNHLLGPRKARAGTHTAFMSTMSHGDWDALKEISPLLGIAPAGMKYKSPLLA